MRIREYKGRPISEPGWYSAVPVECYHSPGMCAGPSVSSTDLRTVWSKSLAHMHLTWAENPARQPRPVSRQMVLGAAAHHFLLGEDGYSQRFVTQPQFYPGAGGEERPWHNGANWCKDWNEEQAENGKTWVTVAELESIVKMAASLTLEGLVQHGGLLKGFVELSGFFKDAETGLWIKVRPDVVPNFSGEFVDLKTTADITTPGLQATLRRHGYCMQGALVWEAAEALDVPWRDFILMFVETMEPYCSRVVPLHVDDLTHGRQQNRFALRKIATAISTNHWSGPGEGDYNPLPLAKDERERIRARLKDAGLA